MSFVGRALAVSALVFALAAVGSPSEKKANPPTKDDLVGVWIGFDRDELIFTRVVLNPDSTGILARVSPSDTILHDQGVHVFRITKWTLAGWDVSIHMVPVSNAYKVGYVKGRAGLASLSLTIGGSENGGWKEEPFLYHESRILVSNEETKAKIYALR